MVVYEPESYPSEWYWSTLAAPRNAPAPVCCVECVWITSDPSGMLFNLYSLHSRIIMNGSLIRQELDVQMFTLIFAHLRQKCVFPIGVVYDGRLLDFLSCFSAFSLAFRSLGVST